MKPVIVEMAQACTFPDCDCDSPYRAAGACVKPAQAAERAVQLPPLPDGLLDDPGPIWSLIEEWSSAEPGEDASAWADRIDAEITGAMQDYARAAVAALPVAPTPEPVAVAWHNPRADALRSALREIADTKSLTATPEQFARWLQRTAEKALTDDAMAEPALPAAPAPAARVDARRLTPFDAVARAMDMASLLAGSVAMNDTHKADAYAQRLRTHLIEYIYPQDTAPAAAAVPVPPETVPLPRYRELVGMHHDLLVTMQAALIEWQHGKGAEAALGWIVNTLAGPGLLPDESEPWGNDAQMWMNANRTDKMPACHCGRPSHIGWMGQGFCSDEHYQQARAHGITQQPRGER